MSAQNMVLNQVGKISYRKRKGLNLVELSHLGPLNKWHAPYKKQKTLPSNLCALKNFRHS